MHRIGKIAWVVIGLSLALYYFLKFTRFSTPENQGLELNFNKGIEVLEDLKFKKFVGEWETTSPDSVRFYKKEQHLPQFSERKSSPHYSAHSQPTTPRT